MIVRALGKFYDRCEMCGEDRHGMMYRWKGFLTEKLLKVCRNCAIREGGKKNIGGLDEKFNQEK